MQTQSELNAFQKLAIATVLATLFLVFVGGLVRASGAGLGCPDWPHCWGSWWPPSDVSQIDATRYDLSLFNPVKMWTEYVNRLIGVTIGLLITATFVASFAYRKTRPTIFWGAFGSLLLVLFEGWLGALVVRSELHQGMITAHMLGAVLLVSLLLYITFLANEEHWRISLDEGLKGKLRRIGWVLYGATLLQIGLGSQVREALGEIHRSFPELARADWVAELGWIDHIHRSFSWVIIAASLMLVWQLRKHQAPQTLQRVAFFILGVILLQVLMGVGLVYGGVPWGLQLLHTGFSTVLICAESWALLMLRSPQPERVQTRSFASVNQTT